MLLSDRVFGLFDTAQGVVMGMLLSERYGQGMTELASSSSVVGV